MMDGEEVQLKPDALAHLADALTEDIVATPSHQLAIEEIVDAGRSRELVFRFDDILAEAISSSSDRPAPLGSRAIWNLADALCEDIATHPDETVLTEVSDGRSDDRSLAGKFDDILRRDPHLAMAGLKLPRQPGPTYLALYVKATLAQLLDRLIAPLQSRAAAGALATVATAAIVTSVVYQPWRQSVEPDRLAATSPGAPKSPAVVVAHFAPPPVADIVPSPVPADARNAGSAARSETSAPPAIAEAGGEMRAAALPEPPKPSAVSRPAEPPPAPDLALPPALAEGGNAGGAPKSEAPPLPPAVAKDGGEMRVAAALPELLKSPAVARLAPPRAPDPATPAVAADGGDAGSAAKPGASPRPPAIAADEGEKQIAVASPVSPMAPVESHPAPEGGNAGSGANLEASLPPPAVAAGTGEKRVAAARRTHTAAAVSAPAAGSQPDRKRERSPVVVGHPEKSRQAAVPGIHGPPTPPDLPAVPTGLPTRLSAWSGSPVDTETGLKALEESARNGDVSALWKLGRIYADGDGVPQNHLLAFEYFRRITAAPDVEDLRSAKARFIANAFVEVGRYYLTGVANSDLKPDPVRAHQVFTYAAVYFADPDAQYELARAFLDGVGVARDQTQGARWLYQAAMKGQYDAQAKFGSLLFAGMGQVIPRDAAQGLMWLKIAMDTAPRAAEGSIAAIYETAWKQATDEERAAASAYYEQWRRGRKLPSESDKLATGATPAAGAGARNPPTRSQGSIGVGF